MRTPRETTDSPYYQPEGKEKVAARDYQRQQVLKDLGARSRELEARS